MMKIEEIRSILVKILDAEAVHWDIPSDSDWENLEKRFNTNFPEEFKSFMALLAEYVFPGDILNVKECGNTNGNDTILFSYEHEMKNGSWPEDMIPFYSIGNGDYFSLSASDGQKSAVYYIYHEDNSIEKYSNSFEEWIRALPDFLS